MLYINLRRLPCASFNHSLGLMLLDIKADRCEYFQGLLWQGPVVRFVDTNIRSFGSRRVSLLSLFFRDKIFVDKYLPPIAIGREG